MCQFSVSKCCTSRFLTCNVNVCFQCPSWSCSNACLLNGLYIPVLAMDQVSNTITGNEKHSHMRGFTWHCWHMASEHQHALDLIDEANFNTHLAACRRRSDADLWMVQPHRSRFDIATPLSRLPAIAHLHGLTCNKALLP